MITITDKRTREVYRGHTVDSVVRRVYGRAAHVRTVQQVGSMTLATITLISPRIDEAERIVAEVWYEPGAARDRGDEYLDDADVPEALSAVARETLLRDTAARSLDDADLRWRETIRAAIGSGHTLDDVAQYAAVTRQRVMQIRDNTR